jgi:hypothetical protein
MGRFLGASVSARFGLVALFAGIYYLQLYVFDGHWARAGCVYLLIALLVVAAAANYGWVADCRDRLVSGIRFLRTTGLANATAD